MKPIDACRHIQNKSFFFDPLPEGSPELDQRNPKQDWELSTPCWCLKTHEAFGPDAGEVWLNVCVKGRACFEPEVEI